MQFRGNCEDMFNDHNVMLIDVKNALSVGGRHGSIPPHSTAMSSDICCDVCKASWCMFDILKMLLQAIRLGHNASSVCVCNDIDV